MDVAEPTLDLTPRHPEPAATRPKRNRRKWVSIGLLVLVLAGGALVVTKFLTNVLDYYCNVDEVNHKAGCEDGRSLRIQGTVVKGSIKAGSGVTDFDLTFNKVTVPVVYEGDPGGLFQECIPVVVHGVMRDGVFDGDEVEVKHTNDYAASTQGQKNLAEAQKESVACLQQQ